LDFFETRFWNYFGTHFSELYSYIILSCQCLHNRELTWKRVGVWLSVQTLSVCMVVPSVSYSNRLSEICMSHLFVSLSAKCVICLFFRPVCLSVRPVFLIFLTVRLFCLSIRPIKYSIMPVCLLHLFIFCLWRTTLTSKYNPVTDKHGFPVSKLILHNSNNNVILSNLTLNLVQGDLKTHALKNI